MSLTNLFSSGHCHGNVDKDFSKAEELSATLFWAQWQLLHPSWREAGSLSR